MTTEKMILKLKQDDYELFYYGSSWSGTSINMVEMQDDFNEILGLKKYQAVLSTHVITYAMNENDARKQINENKHSQSSITKIFEI